MKKGGECFVCVFIGYFSSPVLVQNRNVLCVSEQGIMTRMHRRKQRMPGIYGIIIRFGCFGFLWISQEGLCPEFVKDKEKTSGPFLCREPPNSK